METIDCEKINYTILVPTMIEQLLNSHSLSDSDLSSLEVIGYGTAPTRSATRRRMRDELPHVRFVQGFGQTEAGVPVYFEDREEDITPGYIGPPNVLSDVKIIRDNGEVARPGEIGEIVFRTPALMLGYYKNTEATDRFFDQGREWGRTGDLGFVDEYSHVTITGRMKDMYISGGENVYPVEIEQVLLRHPSISEAVVFGVPDETWGEVGCACVIRKGNEQLSEEDILAYCRKHLGKFKCPKYVNFYDSFPRNALGKVVKGALTPDFSAFLE